MVAPRRRMVRLRLNAYHRVAERGNRCSSCGRTFGRVIAMSKTIRIANGAGFLGDWIDAPRRIVERTQIDYLTIEHLAELTMSILARQREKDASAGFAEDFIDILKSLTPALKSQPRLKIVAN